MSQVKPREFWVDPTPCEEDEENSVYDALQSHPKQGPLQWQASLIHVIEYSAFQKSVETLNHIRSSICESCGRCKVCETLKELGVGE